MHDEAVVIGGGVLGLAVAYELVCAGTSVRSVYPAAGRDSAASAAAGAMLGAFGEVTADDTAAEIVELEFRVAAQRMYPEWLDRVAASSGRAVPVDTGTFVIANNESEGDRPAMRRIVAEAARLAEPCEFVAPEDVPGLRPAPRCVPTQCVHLPNEHSVRSGDLLDALEGALAASPLWRHDDVSVTRVLRAGERWRVTDDHGGHVEAPHVVLAAGVRSFEILDEDVRREAVLPAMLLGKGISGVVRGEFGVRSTIRTPNRAFACGTHVVPRGPGRLYIGATNFVSTEEDADALPHPGELHSLLDDVIHQVNVDVRDGSLESLRVGFRPVPAHRRPVVGATPIRGLHVATGTYRNGVLMAPRVARIVAAGVREEPALFANPFGTSPQVESDLDRLARIGVRDVVALMQEPRSSLPYNRGPELTDYVTTLFRMIVSEDGSYDQLRKHIVDELERSPFSETMNRLFYRIAEESRTERAS